jgi:hypothetical protein
VHVDDEVHVDEEMHVDEEGFYWGSMNYYEILLKEYRELC